MTEARIDPVQPNSCLENAPLGERIAAILNGNSNEPHRFLPVGTARPAMQDLTMLLFTVVFFGLAFLYVKACQKLR